MAENKDTDIIDFRKLIRKVWEKKKLFFFKVWPITFVLSCVYILSIPRYYTSQARVAPEMGGTMDMGGLGSLASSFGIDLNSMQTSDAINPFLYPDLMEDNGFVAQLFSIKVTSEDGEISTDYYTYLRKYQKSPWWSVVKKWVSNLLPHSENKKGGGGSKEFDPYYLSEKDNSVLEAIRGNITILLNEKTGVVTIGTKAQDPLICRTLADSVMHRLQDFITEYRTNKARIDYDYYRALASEAKEDYDKVRRRYAMMADANTRLSLRSAEMKLEDIESDMQLKYNAYTTMNAQLEAAKAKVQERTPAFTKLKGASVPIRPAGPKRMFFVAFMLVLSTIVTIVVILHKDLTKIITVRL